MFNISNVEICLFKIFTTGNQTGPDVAAGLNGFVSFWELWIWTWPSVVSCQSQQIGWIWSQWRKCFSSVQHQNEPRVQIKGTCTRVSFEGGAISEKFIQASIYSHVILYKRSIDVLVASTCNHKKQTHNDGIHALDFISISFSHLLALCPQQLP